MPIACVVFFITEVRPEEGRLVDAEELTVEDFGLSDNADDDAMRSI